jgi:2-oxoglutarate dehydrogenase E2 component (dihydrolipoamide succinyltransferase)
VHEITIPRLNSNDETCTLVEWLCKSGERVTSETALAVLETSKATAELQAEHTGTLEILCESGKDYPFGTVIGYVFGDEAQRQDYVSRQSSRPAAAVADAGAPTVTRGARELMDEHGLVDADLAPLRKRVIKRADIEALLSQTRAAAPRELPLSRRQQAIADVVSRSHASIPKAFLLMRVGCDAAIAALKQASRQSSMMIGLPELLIQVTAGLAGQFPFFFGELIDGRRFVPADEPNVGVTFDVGKGLFIPVLRTPRTMTLKQLAEQMLQMRIKAMRDGFTPEDLNGGHITITLNTDRDVVCQLPIIVPGQTCMVSLGGLQTELYLDDAGQLATRTFTHLGLAYDHRAINGHDAISFVKAIKSVFESAADLISVGNA